MIVFSFKTLFYFFFYVLCFVHFVVQYFGQHLMFLNKCYINKFKLELKLKLELVS